MIKVVNGNKTANGKNSSSNNASNGGEKSKNGNSGRNEVKTEQVETEPEDVRSRNG